VHPTEYRDYRQESCIPPTSLFTNLTTHPLQCGLGVRAIVVSFLLVVPFACGGSGGSRFVTTPPTGGLDSEDPLESPGPSTTPSPAQSSASSVTLRWQASCTRADGTAARFPAGFRIYSGQSPGTYTRVTDVGIVSEFVMEGLAEGSHYFAVAAYDASGMESSLSSAASIALPRQPLKTGGVTR